MKRPIRLLAFISAFAAAVLLGGCEKPQQAAQKRLARANYQVTPADFVRAATSGDEGAVKDFLLAGGDPNARNEEGATPLMGAAEKGHVRVVRALAEGGARLDEQGREGWTALMAAAFNNQPEVARALLDAGAKTDLRDDNGWTALMQAVYQGHARIVSGLVEKGAQGLDRALLVASLMGHAEVIGLLLEGGAEINARTEDGETSLMLAAQKGRLEAARLLLARGADKTLTNNLGETAQAMAISKGHGEIATLIAEAPAVAATSAPIIPPEPPPTPAATPSAPAAELPAVAAATASPEPAATPSEPAGASPTVAPTPATVAETMAAPQPGSPEAAWFARHRLDLNDAGMLEQDPDGDGFNNRDEFLADTDPRDAASRPSPLAQLKLAEYREESVPFVLDSVKGDEARVRPAKGGKTQSVREGDNLPGTPYKIERVRARTMTDKHGEPSDVSEITLQDQASGERVLLVRGMTARTKASHALLYVEGEGRTFKVRQGEEFEFPAKSGRMLTVVDIRPSQVVVKEGTRTFTIPKAENP